MQGVQPQAPQNYLAPSIDRGNSFEIEVLILNRIATPKLGRADLIRRAGLKNVAKGLRRLDQLCSGDLTATTSLIAGLPAAFGTSTRGHSHSLDLDVKSIRHFLRPA